MKHLYMTLFMIISLTMLSGCDDKDKDDKRFGETEHAPTEIIDPEDDDKKDDEDDVTPEDPVIAECEATANPISEFVRIETYYGALQGQAFTNTETGGLLPLTLVEPAAEGDLTLELDSSISLVEGQLITYQANNFDYYVARIASIDGNTLTLDERGAVVSGIAAGQNVWNFYDEATHPKINGFNAIADFSYRSTAGIVTAGAKHVLFGDSWFDLEGFEDRISLRYPDATVVNLGIGGNTLCNLLERFDTDVPSEAPDYVWINSSINDYYADVSAADYKIRLQDLISKVQAIGATAIVIDPAPLDNGSTSDGVPFLTLSMRYASQVLDLLTETQSTE